MVRRIPVQIHIHGKVIAQLSKMPTLLIGKMGMVGIKLVGMFANV